MSEIENEPPKKSGALVAIVIILLLLLAVMAYLWQGKNKELDQCSLDNQQLNADMNGMEEMLAEYTGGASTDLKKDFKAMLQTYDALIEKDSTQADSLRAQMLQIEQLQKEVESGKMSARRLYKAKQEIETMKRIMRGYIVQIDSLNTLNLQLSNDLDLTKRDLTQTSVERDNYKKEAEEKAEQVKKGSKLQAYNFNTVPLKRKLNNTMGETKKANNTVQIKCAFTLSENPITSSGKKKVYLQVVSPDGKTLQQSSSHLVEVEGGQVPYSDFKEIDYRNQRIDMAVYYSLKGEELDKGNYKVNIYCQGQLIGSDNFVLK